MRKEISKVLDKKEEEILVKYSQKNTEKYIEELKKVEAFKGQAADKQHNSLKAIERLDGEIKQLDEQYLIELDEDKQRRILSKKKELIIDRESERGIAGTDFKHHVMKKLNDLEPLAHEARVEYDLYRGEVNHQSLEYKELIDDINIRSARLASNHLYNSIDGLKRSIQEPPKRIQEQSKKNLWSDPYAR